MKKIINKLYKFVSNLISMLEADLEKLKLEQANNINDKKNITETLNKLVRLIILLNKLNSDSNGEKTLISNEDKKIIKYFLEKYNRKN